MHRKYLVGVHTLLIIKCKKKQTKDTHFLKEENLDDTQEQQLCEVFRETD